MAAPSNAFPRPSFCINHWKSHKEMSVLGIFLLTAGFYGMTCAQQHESAQSVEVCTVIMKTEGVVRSWPLRLWRGSPAPTRPNRSFPVLISRPQATLLYRQLSEHALVSFMIQTEIYLLSLRLRGILLESPLACNRLTQPRACLVKQQPTAMEILRGSSRIKEMWVVMGSSIQICCGYI